MPWVVCHEPRYIDNDSRLVHDVLTALALRHHHRRRARARAAAPEWRMASRSLRRRWPSGGRDARRGSRRAGESHPSAISAWPGCGRRCRSFRFQPGTTTTRFCAREFSSARASAGARSTTSRARSSSTSSRVIGKLGFAGFFLVMWDAVRFRARSNGILCQGRGSAANSAVAYCLGDHRGRSGEARTCSSSAFSPRSRVDGQTEAARHRRRLRARSARGSARLRVRQLRPRPRGDHVHRADVSRAQRGAGFDARVRLSGGAWRRISRSACTASDPVEGAAYIAETLAREVRSRSRQPARQGDCSRRWRRSRDCRVFARRTSADSCSRRSRSATICRSSRRRWVARSSSSTRTISTRSACRSSTSSDSARCRWCGARST